MLSALLRCAALISLTRAAIAESTIEDMLRGEVEKSKRTDISLGFDKGQASHSEWAKLKANWNHDGAATRVVDDSGTGDERLDAVTSILKAGASAARPSSDVVKDWNGVKVDLSNSSQQIVSGMIEAFMHRVTLEPGEKQCLENSVGTFTSSMVQAGKDAVDALKQLFKGADDKGVHASASTGLSVLPLLMDAGVKVSSMVATGTQLAKNCVQGDALDLLNQTGHNIRNATYIKQRFVVSGVDIAQALADGIVSFEEHNFRKFGADIGTALRKVLLSKANTGRIGIPDGVPQERIIEQVTEGVYRGFFAKGMKLIVTDKADSKVNITIDLHKCIAENHELFQEIWYGAWSFFAQIAANKEQHGLGGFGGLFAAQKGEDRPAWAQELFNAMLEVPLSLERCGFGLEMQEMMAEAIKTLKFLRFKMKMPKEKVKADAATEKMALAVEAWTNWHFLDFGVEIGALLRELVLQFFPKKYSVDASGQLQRYLVTETENNSKALSLGSHMPLFAVFGVMLAIMMSLVALKSLRAVSRLQSSREATIDVETAARQDECIGVE
mmetsp:Transcript_147071/g.273894  ORF Transcript_147071/g.273894 Transcript_147071/m.273894 type:complete len:555 (+) Transcript_147071:72-1736(+)